MRLVAFEQDGRFGVGRLEADGVRAYDLKDLGPDALTLGAASVVTAQAEGRTPQPGDDVVPLDAVRLRAPIPRPRRNIFCVGKNYAAHAAEMGAPEAKDRQYPIVFTKPPETVIDPGAAIAVDAAVSTQVDYEGEIAIVIGRGGRGIKADQARDHIWGATLVNDVSVRDLQYRHVQYLIGKAQDRSCPMGPALVSKDEFDLGALRLRTWVNDELRQDGHTSQLIFSPETVIAEISAGITLYPGDVISLGTPAGVGAGFDPPKFLTPGDQVRIAVDEIGELRNPVAAYPV